MISFNKKNLYVLAVITVCILFLGGVVVSSLLAGLSLSNYSTLNYKLVYPSSWQVAELGGNKGTAARFLVSGLNGTEVGVDVAETLDLSEEVDVGVFANGYLDQLELDPEISVAYIEDTEVSGLRANKIISEKSYEGQKRVGVEVFVVKRDLVYKFYLSTTEEEYGKALPMFESVLSSVQII